MKYFITVSGGWNFANSTLNSSFPEVLYKRRVLWKFSKFTDKHRKQSFGGVMSKENMSLETLKNSQKNIFAGVYFLTKLQAGNLKLSEAATVSQGVLKNLTN